MVAFNVPPSNSVAGRQHPTATFERRASLNPLPILVHVEGAPAEPSPLKLASGSCILGAGEGADLVIESDTVSRQHAELRLVPEGVMVTDLGSKNGSYYLGQRFQNMSLPPESRFRLGSVTIQISIDREALVQVEAPVSQGYGDLTGVSAAMRQLFAQLVRLEGSRVNLLIAGESGTGKELLARAIHDHSLVRRGPFVVVNCGALERQLVRSELFGHRRGAFTGAVQNHVGAFEAAQGGTLFLDEIGELPLDVQPMLLRALEQRKMTAVGSHQEIAFDVRLIAATHRDLPAAVRKGTFREDLFYRIQVVRLELPPLRERLEDVAVLAQSFAMQQGAPTLPDDFIDALRRHDWPGNIRELRNAVEAFLALGVVPQSPSSGHAHSIDAALAQFVDPRRTFAEQKQEIFQRFTRAYLERLLRDSGGNQSEAARLSGLQRSYLGKLVGKLGLRQG